MSNKSTRRKISLELPKKASVFDRLGTKNPLATCKKNSEINVNRRKINSETLRVKLTNKPILKDNIGQTKIQQIRLIKEEGTKRLSSAVSVVSLPSVVHDIKSNRGPEITSWESWDQRKLEEEDEKTLEKKRLLLQKELEREMAATKQRDKEKEKKRSPSSSSTSSSSSSSSSDSSSSDSSTDSSSSSGSSDKIIDKKRKPRTKDKVSSSSARTSKKRASSSSSPDTKRIKDKKKSSASKKRSQPVTPSKSVSTSHTKKPLPKSVKSDRDTKPKDKFKEKPKPKEKEKVKEYDTKPDKFKVSTNRKHGGRSISRSPPRKSTSKRSVSPTKAPRKRSLSPSPKSSSKLRRESSPEPRSKNINRDDSSPIRKSTSNSRNDRRRDNSEVSYSRDKQRDSPRSDRRVITSRGKLSPDRRDRSGRDKDRKVIMSRGSSPSDRVKRDDYSLSSVDHDLRDSRDVRDLRDRESDRRGKSLDTRDDRGDWKERRDPSHDVHLPRVHHDDYRNVSGLMSSRGLRDSSRDLGLRHRESDLPRGYDDDSYWNYDDPLLEAGPPRVPLTHNMYREDRRSDWSRGRLSGPLPLFSDRMSKSRRIGDWDPPHRGRGRGRNDKDWLGRPRRRDDHGDGKRHHEIPASTLQALASVPSLMDIEVSPIIKADSKEALPPSLLIGDDGDSPDRNKTWEFNPKSKTWERKIDPPPADKKSDKDVEVGKEGDKVGDTDEEKKQQSDSMATIDADNFSDFSDDADEILNREEPDEPTVHIELEDSEKMAEMDGKECRSDDRRSDQEEVWDGMDFEEISDEEQFEEEGSRPSIVDALEVDWASLVSAPHPLIDRGKGQQFMKRYSPKAMLVRLGVATSIVRKEVLEKVHAVIDEQKDGEDDLNSQQKLHLWKQSRTWVPELLTDIGPFRQALCARKDLEIRRRLCQLPERDMGVESTPLINDTELYRHSVHLFTSKTAA